LLPLRDENPSSLRPFVTWALIFTNVAVFIWEIAGPGARFEAIIKAYGFIPARFQEGSAYYTVITSMFLHGGIMHIGGNMLYLHIFGDNVEDVCGRLSYVAFYLLCGVGATFTHLAFSSGSTVPAVGASGAISGLLGAYVLLFPQAKILTAVPVWGFIRLVHLPAYAMIGFWFLYQLLLAVIAVEAGIAFWAHIGGFLTGLALIRLFARRKGPHPLARGRTIRPYWA